MPPRPARPTTCSWKASSTSCCSSGWIDHDGGIVDVGHDSDGFAFDNERPHHAVLLQPFRIATSLVTGGEWVAFIDDGGYRRPELWMSDGWATVQAHGWQAPQ